jgi:hypothetical protein
MTLIIPATGIITIIVRGGIETIPTGTIITDVPVFIIMTPVAVAADTPLKIIITVTTTVVKEVLKKEGPVVHLGVPHIVQEFVGFPVQTQQPINLQALRTVPVQINRQQ